MRRHDREITEENEMLSIMEKCDACRLAFNDDGYPYVFVVNFGIGTKDGRTTLYFHSALEGKKVEVMQKDNRATFEMDHGHKLEYFADKGYCTMSYESVIGRGRVHIIEDAAEKQEALELLMAHYHDGERAYFNPAAIPRTLVYALSVEQMTGKRKLPKG